MVWVLTLSVLDPLILLSDIRFNKEAAKDIENKVRYEPENLSQSKNLGRIPETGMKVVNSDSEIQKCNFR